MQWLWVQMLKSHSGQLSIATSKNPSVVNTIYIDIIYMVLGGRDLKFMTIFVSLNLVTTQIEIQLGYECIFLSSTDSDFKFSSP